MSVGTINNNTAQLYTQEKPVTASLKQQDAQSSTTAMTAVTDSVQISEQAKALLAREALSNGGGIIPPGNAPVQTQGNGEGIEPPKT